MKRVLYISAFGTHPTVSGCRARSVELCRQLSEQGADVSILTLGIDGVDRQAMRKYWGENWIPLEPDLKTVVTRGARYFTRRMSSRFGLPARPSLDEQVSEQYRSFTQRLAKREKYDLVIVQYVQFSQLLESFPAGTRRAIDTQDLFTNRHESYRKLGLVPQWWSLSEKEEARGLQRADTLIGIHRGDSQRLSELAPTREVITIGHAPAAGEHSVSRPTGTIGYLGSWNAENRAAIAWFVTHVWPLVRRAVPDGRLRIAGPVARSLRRAPPSTELLPWVKHVREFYGGLNAAICPVLLGTGLKVRVTEALAYGVPVVTTPLGGGYLGEYFGRCLTVADGAEKFAARVVELLRCPEPGPFATELKAYRAASEMGVRTLIRRPDLSVARTAKDSPVSRTVEDNVV